MHNMRIYVYAGEIFDYRWLLTAKDWFNLKCVCVRRSGTEECRSVAFKKPSKLQQTTRLTKHKVPVKEKRNL